MDFFISYTKADVAWAEWIAWQVEAAGYSTIFQAWDFRPGANFVLEMDKASREAERTIAVLSPGYLDATYTHPEWARAFAKDPRGDQSLLLPVRVLDCQPQGLLAQIVYIDLVGLNEEDAKNTLLAQIRSDRAKPRLKPLFPGEPAPPKPAFPAAPLEAASAGAHEQQALPQSSTTALATAPVARNGRPALAPEIILKTEQELAKHMGPIAPRLVRRAANKATTAEELYDLLAMKIRDSDEREDFLRRLTEQPDSLP